MFKYLDQGEELVPKIRALVDRLHAGGLVHLDLRGRENLIRRPDGEVVVHDAAGRADFGLLSRRAHLQRPLDIKRAAVSLPSTYYVFDLLSFSGLDTRGLGLVKRKQILAETLPSAGPLRYSEHIDGNGETLYRHVCEMRLEGIVGKRADSHYQEQRSADWIKRAAIRTDDFVIVGYTDPKGALPGLGALHLAHYVRGELIYTGRVGSGFSDVERVDIKAALEEIRVAEPACTVPRRTAGYWTEPTLVCEVCFKDYTGGGNVRQPVFSRLRPDKPASDCGRQPVAPELEDAPAPEAPALSNPDKVFWPREGYTKGDLANYYRSIAPWILPYLADRPVVLTRFPDGIEGKSFFQKNAPDFAPDWIRIEPQWSDGSEREIGYFVVDSEDALLYLVNLGTIPLHMWSARMRDLQRPDWCILDLDAKGSPLTQVVEVARALYRLCRDIGLPIYVKTSGSSGLHLLIPLAGQLEHDMARTLAQLLAGVVIAEHPHLATQSRSARAREGRVYIDCLQNGRGRLLAAPFCVRPVPGARVSMPLKWSEVTQRLNPGRYTMKTALRRMRQLSEDPMGRILDTRPALPKALAALQERLPKTAAR